MINKITEKNNENCICIFTTDESESLMDNISDNNFTSKNIWQGYITFLARKNHPLQKQSNLTFSALNKYSITVLIYNKNSWHDNIDFKDYLGRFSSIEEFSSIDIWINNLERTNNIGIISSVVFDKKSALLNKITNIKEIPMKEKKVQKMILVHAKNSSNAVKIFSEFISDYL